ncbi:MAG: DUF2182 domain-containing protein [Pseudonocardiaceae bacterium]
MITQIATIAGRVPRRVSSTGRLQQRLHPRLTPLLVLLGASWLLVIVMSLMGDSHEHPHHRLEHSSLAALLSVVAAGQLMTLAMMGPSCLPAARHVAMNTLHPARTVPAFLVGYLLPWSGFLAAVAVGDVTLHRLSGEDGWLAQHDTVLPALVLLLAAAWQLTPAKRACLRSCRSGRVLPAGGHRADFGALRFGTRHGLACLGSCGPMMFVMLVSGSWQLLWMLALGWLIWLEKTRWLGRRLAHPTAAGFAVLSAVLVFLQT